MKRGWEVQLKNGSVMNEVSDNWKDVPNKDIVRLTLHFDNRRWDLENKQAYFIKNTASMAPGINSSFRIEKRCIGYYEGADKIHYTVDECTGNFEISVVNNR